MNRKTILVIVIFFIVQTFVTGFCCKLSAEKYYFRDHNCEIRSINISYGKLLDSQKEDMTLGEDPSEEYVIKLFQEQKNRYSNGSRVDSDSDTFYLYEYDRKTGVLTTYSKVCNPEPYNYNNPELERIAKKIHEIGKTKESAKKYILNELNSANKEDK